MAISAMPIHAARGCFFRSRKACMSAPLRRGPNAFAEQPRRPEDEHGDEDEEREHVLVVAAEQREVRIVDAALARSRRTSRDSWHRLVRSPT